MKDQKSGVVYPIIAAIIVACILALAYFFLSAPRSLHISSQGESSSQPETLHQSLQTFQVGNKPSLTQGLSFQSPTALITYFHSTLRSGDTKLLESLLSQALPSPPSQSLLKALAPYQNTEFEISEIGELDINRHSRWSLREKGAGREIVLDLKASKKSHWNISGIQLLEEGRITHTTLAPNDDSHSLNEARQFIEALIQQDYSTAMSLVDPLSVSGARVTSLCTIFEEEKYSLPTEKALRSLFKRKGVVGYMVNLVTSDSTEKGQFGLTMRKVESQNTWQVVEINLNKLLTGLINDAGESDAYYTPLVETPEGGDNLVIYFDSNKTSLNKRAKRQLTIVAKILAYDQTKVITLNGHTDAIGSDKDNLSLSLKRAREVESYLVGQQVNPDQIKVSAYGESKPVLDNDSAIGRSVNRRAEVFLDF